MREERDMFSEVRRQSRLSREQRMMSYFQEMLNT
jgi:hypothetical protein